MALRILATVVGSGFNDDTGVTNITLQSTTGAIAGSFLYLNSYLPVDTSSLPIGTNVWVVIALNSTEQTAIAGAVTINPVSTND